MKISLLKLVLGKNFSENIKAPSESQHKEIQSLVNQRFPANLPQVCQKKVICNNLTLLVLLNTPYPIHSCTFYNWHFNKTVLWHFNSSINFYVIVLLN